MRSEHCSRGPGGDDVAELLECGSPLPLFYQGGWPCAWCKVAASAIPKRQRTAALLQKLRLVAHLCVIGPFGRGVRMPALGAPGTCQHLKLPMHFSATERTGMGSICWRLITFGWNAFWRATHCRNAELRTCNVSASQDQLSFWVKVTGDFYPSFCTRTRRQRSSVWTRAPGCWRRRSGGSNVEDSTSAASN